jgi:octaprenyl-diphosphate synthase
MPLRVALQPVQEKAPELSDILAPVARELLLVQKRVADAAPFEKQLSTISPAVKHILSSGGKCLRPALVLLSCAASGEEAGKAVEYAAMMELVHIGSLVFDDLLDGSTLRRGRETVNSRWGEGMALLTTAHIYLQAANRALRERAGAHEVLLNTVNRMFRGEVLQFGSQGKTEITEEEYLEIVRDKSASLFSACCQLGALAAGADESTQSALRDYGLNVGIAFQITDDLLNIFANQKRLGKRVGTDLEDARLTLPVIVLFENLSGQKRTRLKKALKDGNSHLLGLGDLRKMIVESGSYAVTLAKARQFASSAAESIRTLPTSPSVDSLFSLCDFVVSRKY